MDVAILIGCAIACLGSFFWIWGKDNGRRFILTPVMMLLVNELGRILPAGFHAYNIGYCDSTPAVIMTGAFLCLCAGSVLGLSLGNYRTSLPANFRAKPIEVRTPNATFYGMVAVAGFLVIIGMLLYRGFPPVGQALVALVAGDDSHEVSVMVGTSRAALTKGYLFGQEEYRGQGVFKFITQTGWTIVVLAALASYWKTKERRWKYFAFGSFILSFLFIAGDGTRGPFLEVIFVAIVLASFIFVFKPKQIFVFGVVGVLLAMALSAYSPKALFILKEPNWPILLLGSILERVFVGNAINDVYAIEFLRDGTLTTRGGALHFRDMVASLPGTSGGKPFAFELFQIISPMSIRGTAYYTGTYITKTMMDFGTAGTMIIFFAIGLLTGWVQPMLLAVKRTPINLALFSYAVYQLGFFVIAGPFPVITQILLVGLTMTIFLLARDLVRAKPKAQPALQGETA